MAEPIGVQFGSSQTGLVGTVGYTIYNPDATVAQARTTAGIAEIGATAAYVADETLATVKGLIVQWDTGGGSPIPATVSYMEAIDATISSRSSHTAANVWAVGSRTLTSFGTLVADVATAVWAAGARTLTAFGFSVTVGTNNDKTGYARTAGERTSIATAVWAAGTRTLTSFGDLLRALINRAVLVMTGGSGTLVIYEDDDVTPKWTANVTDATAPDGTVEKSRGV